MYPTITAYHTEWKDKLARGWVACSTPLSLEYQVVPYHHTAGREFGESDGNTGVNVASHVSR